MKDQKIPMSPVMKEALLKMKEMIEQRLAQEEEKK